MQKPQRTVSRLACIALSFDRSCRSSFWPGRLFTAWMVSLVGFYCRMVSNWWQARSIGRIPGGWCALPRTTALFLHCWLCIFCPLADPDAVPCMWRLAYFFPHWCVAKTSENIKGGDEKMNNSRTEVEENKIMDIEITHSMSNHHRVFESYRYIDSSLCLAHLTLARVGTARYVHVQLGASPHVIRWDIVCLSPQSHTSISDSFHIFIMARQRPFGTISRFNLLQVDEGSPVPLSNSSFGMIPLSRHLADRSPREFHSSTHNVVRAYRFCWVNASGWKPVLQSSMSMSAAWGHWKR